jgi:VIT1/CCC1 family predicted Fe2+/Mn2+ transporter
MPGNSQLDVSPPVPARSKRLLDPVERVSEILFGLIMALTFTLTISVVETDHKEIRSLLLAAISCNIAWGLVDAVMYTLASLAARGHDRMILDFVRKSGDSSKSREFIRDAMPELVANLMSAEDLEKIRKSLIDVPDPDLRIGLSFKDFKMATGIFLLVFLSTFPIALPFLFVKAPDIALRVSNLVAIVLMFLCGWLLAKYGGFSKWLTGIVLVLLGVILVLITIALGG